MREHGRHELRDKLCRKCFDPVLVDEVLTQLVAEGLLDDGRFTETFVRSRRNRGEGPLRIQAELKQRGISDDLIDTFLDLSGEGWDVVITAVWRKKFAGHRPRDIKERARQTRFLHYRGFTSEQIRQLFRQDECVD